MQSMQPSSGAKPQSVRQAYEPPCLVHHGPAARLTRDPQQSRPRAGSANDGMLMLFVGDDA